MLWCLHYLLGILWLYHFDAFEADTLKEMFLHTPGISINLMHICKCAYTHHGNNLFLAIFSVFIQNHSTTDSSNSSASLLGIHHSLRWTDVGTSTETVFSLGNPQLPELCRFNKLVLT